MPAVLLGFGVVSLLLKASGGWSSLDASGVVGVDGAASVPEGSDEEGFTDGAVGSTEGAEFEGNALGGDELLGDGGPEVGLGPTGGF